jgi:putative FmdB family regulatory protein
MPLYEYICQKCGRKTEVLQGMKQGPLRTCPHCGGKKLKKAFSAPAIQFKGSGFYITDYARGTNAGKSGESPKATGESKSTESKPADAAADSKPSEPKKEKTSEAKTTSKKDSKKNS